MLTEAQRVALREIKAKLPRGTLVLDVGFGQGEFLEALAKAGYGTCGTDIVPAFVEAAVLAGSVSKHRFFLTADPSTILEDFNPEAVTCFEVLEHVPDPAAFLDTMPRGVPTWFSTPSARRWSVRLTGKYEPWDYPPNHLRRFDADMLRCTLMEAGYRKVAVREMPVRGREILGPLLSAVAYRTGAQRNVSEYNQVGSGPGVLHVAATAVRVVTLPATAVVAAALNAGGYRGGNLLAYGVKE